MDSWSASRARRWSLPSCSSPHFTRTVCVIAEPAWTSKDAPPYVIKDGNTIVASQGNWRQGQSPNALNQPRYIFLWWLDGAPWFGVVPPHDSPPEVHFQGEGHNVALVPVGVHVVRFQIYAGNYDDRPTVNRYEWGTGNVVTGEPYVVDVLISVGTPVPTPGPLDELREGVAILRGSAAYRAHFVNVVKGTDRCADALARLGG